MLTVDVTWRASPRLSAMHTVQYGIDQKSARTRTARRIASLHTVIRADGNVNACTAREHGGSWRDGRANVAKGGLFGDGLRAPSPRARAQFVLSD